MAMSYKANRIVICICFNCFLLIMLHSINVNAKLLENLCLFKFITGKECWNCGMTRAFLSVIHFNFQTAYEFNHNVVVVFPLTIAVYFYSWGKFVMRKGDQKDE